MLFSAFDTRLSINYNYDLFLHSSNDNENKMTEHGCL